MANVGHISARTGDTTPPAAIEGQRSSAAHEHSAVVEPDIGYQRHADELAQSRQQEEALSGRGKGGQRFGGMGPAGFRDGQADDLPPEDANIAAQRGDTDGSQPTGTFRKKSPPTNMTDSTVSSDAAHEPPKTSRNRSAMIDSEADIGIGGAGYGRMAVSLDEGEQRRKNKEANEKDGHRFWPGRNKSFGASGGMGPGYMRMIHALAKEDEAAERKARRERRRIRRHLRKERDADREEEDEEPQADGPVSEKLTKYAAAPEHASATPTLARTAECTSAHDEEGRELRQQLKKAELEQKKQEKKKHDQGDDDDDENDNGQMSNSSLLAIHRPIEQRRRTMSDLHEGDEERDRNPVDDEEVAGIEQDQLEYSEKHPGVGARQETDASMASIDTVERRQKLSDKLMDVFGLDEPEDIVAEFPCWLFRSILMQGFLYVTGGHLCFYAYLAQKEGATIRSGSLSVRGSKTRRYHKHWLILKDNLLSWYPSSTDPYFPDGHIDLHYCLSVEESSFHKTHFKVTTASKRWHFSADSEASKSEWVKAIKKVVFRCQNEGESVKIAIPLETIVDVEKTHHIEFAEMLRVRVYDADEGYSLDEYYLSYFKDIDNACERINSVIEAFREHHPQGRGSQEPLPPTAANEQLEDTTKHKTADLGAVEEYRAKSAPKRSQSQSKTGNQPAARRMSKSSQTQGDAQTSQGSPSKASPPRQPVVAQKPAAPAPVMTALQPPEIKKRPAWLPAAKPPPLIVDEEKTAAATAEPAENSVATLKPERKAPAQSSGAGDRLVTDVQSSDVGDRPVTGAAPLVIADGPPPQNIGERPSMESDGTCPNLVPSVSNQPHSQTAAAASDETLAPTKSQATHTYPPPSSAQDTDAHREEGRGSALSRIFSGPASGGRRIMETVTPSNLPGRRRRKSDSAPGGVVEKPMDAKQVEEFRKIFGLGEKEDPLNDWPAFLFRGLPISGHAYVSNNYFCFRSGGILATRTKMILPMSDVVGVAKHRSYRIGYSGFVVIIKGHEEIFFELPTAEQRDACMKAIEDQRDAAQLRRRQEKQAGDKEEDQHRELRELFDLSATRDADPSSPVMPHPQSEAVAEQPPIMFSSTTSDFVTFRPEKPLRFTCFTIGSRGDVQPYIALCKALMAQGHQCRIASHSEYQKWVEGHGIDFAPVGGDPAELMQLMISHDFFTISFMKEAVSKFRGWLDELLDSAWKGCQGSDVIIESPSAIAGYHIAEALQIPYYRAFTMPWTRTRAYPHAFAVPEVHMGGGYNYMTYTMFDQVFWRATSSQVNRWRKNTLGIRPTNLEAMQQHKIPFLYNFSPVVVPPPLDWRENIHVTGYWWLDNPDDSTSKKWEPPEDLVDWMKEAESKDKKVVFVGFGSIIIPDPLEMTRVVVESVERAGVYAIVAKGWSDRSKDDDEDKESEESKKKREEAEKKHHELMDKPFIFQVKSIPHDWLFPRISAAVHHGGAGTTGASLRAGLPTIIKPFFGDQHFYADRVATLGIGSHITNFSVDNLTEALEKATGDEKEIERACLAGEEIRQEDGVATAIECIYRDLEYARSLIPKPSERGKDGVPLESEVKADEDGTSDDSDGSDYSDEDISSTSDSDADAKDGGEKVSSTANEEHAGSEKAPDKAEKKDEEAEKQDEAPKGEISSGSELTAASSAPASQPTESRTTSSDEGWDVMSRGSAVDSGSRDSSTARPAVDRDEADKPDPPAKEAQEEPAPTGLLGRTLGFLGRPSKTSSS